MMKNILRGEAVRRLVRNDSYVTECVILRITRGQGVKEIDNEKRKCSCNTWRKKIKKRMKVTIKYIWETRAAMPVGR